MINWWLIALKSYSAFLQCEWCACVWVYRGNKWTMAQSQSVFDLCRLGLQPAGSFQINVLINHFIVQKTWYLLHSFNYSSSTFSFFSFFFIPVQVSLCFQLAVECIKIPKKGLLHFKINVLFCHAACIQILSCHIGYKQLYQYVDLYCDWNTATMTNTNDIFKFIQ